MYKQVTYSLLLSGLLYNYNFADLIPENNQISVRVNHLFTATLKSNPTTGGSWFVENLPANIELISEEYIQKPAAADVVGSGGKSVFTFRALNPGKSQIRLEYKRSWEKDVEPWKRVNYYVTVTP